MSHNSPEGALSHGHRHPWDAITLFSLSHEAMGWICQGQRNVIIQFRDTYGSCLTTVETAVGEQPKQPKLTQTPEYNSNII